MPYPVIFFFKTNTASFLSAIFQTFSFSFSTSDSNICLVCIKCLLIAHGKAFLEELASQSIEYEA